MLHFENRPDNELEKFIPIMASLKLLVQQSKDALNELMKQKSFM